MSELNKSDVNLDRYYKKNIVSNLSAEIQFHEILRETISGKDLLTTSQVPLTSLIGIAKEYFPGSYQHFKKICIRTVDFLIFKKDTFEPVLAINLKEPPYTPTEDDTFIDALFQAVEIPLLQLEAQEPYHQSIILEQITHALTLINFEEPKKTRSLEDS